MLRTLRFFWGVFMVLLFWWVVLAVFMLLGACTGNAAATAPVCIARCDVHAIAGGK